MSRYAFISQEIPKKVCSACEEEKPFHDFGKHGRFGKPAKRCKACVKASTKDTEYQVVARYDPDPKWDKSKKR